MKLSSIVTFAKYNGLVFGFQCLATTRNISRLMTKPLFFNTGSPPSKIFFLCCKAYGFSYILSSVNSFSNCVRNNLTLCLNFVPLKIMGTMTSVSHTLPFKTSYTRNVFIWQLTFILNVCKFLYFIFQAAKL